MSRKRWIYTQGGNPIPEPIEVSEDWTDAPQRSAPVTDLYMDGVRATDGTDIGSRAKRRAYMQAKGLADFSDFKGTWEKAAKEREAFRSGGGNGKGLREAAARAMEKGKR